MKITSKLIAIMLILACVLTFAACDNTDNGQGTEGSSDANNESGGELVFELSHDGDYYMIMDAGTFRGKELLIPAEYNGVAVKSIENCAFENRTDIEKVIIPEGIEYVGNFAFSGCTSLKSVSVPTSVTRLEDGVFSGCSALVEVKLHDGIVEMGQSVFANCTSLKTIKLPASIKAVSGQLFKGCSALESIVIPEGVEKIQTFSFSGCKSLSEITIPASVVRIEFKTFESCSALTSIDFGGTVADWRNIKTSPQWNVGTGDYTVYCSNGELGK